MENNVAGQSSENEIPEKCSTTLFNDRIIVIEREAMRKLIEAKSPEQVLSALAMCRGYWR